MTHTILVTGGLGFVGSHFTRSAYDAGMRVVVLDDGSGGPPQPAPPGAVVVMGDVADTSLVSGLIRAHRIDTLAHFAGKIQVGQSVLRPGFYFAQNLVKSLALLDVAVAEGVRAFVFSSTAAVYGQPQAIPIVEDSSCAPTNPYGASKLAVEHALASYGVAHGLRWAALRYFNAAGAHPGGFLKEAHEPETHLIPLAIDAALGRGAPLTIFGDDYGTPDGTCIRDYVHVCDLADAHLAAIDALHAGKAVGAVNLGSQRGFSVNEVIAACARVLRVPVPHNVGPRRPGDPPVLVASAERARRVLGWMTRRADLNTIVEDAARARYQ